MADFIAQLAHTKTSLDKVHPTTHFRQFTIGVIVMLMIGCGGGFLKQPLEFDVVFNKADGLEAGQPVTYNDVTIGTVKKVKLIENGQVAVTVSIDTEHTARIFKETQFEIVRAGGFLDFSGSQAIEVTDGGGTERTPLTAGDRIRGIDGWLDRAGEVAETAQDWIADNGPELIEKAKKWKDSPEGQKLISDVEDFAKSARDLSAEQWQSFRDEKLPEIEERALEMKRELEEAGQSEEAQELWESFKKFADKVTNDDEEQEEPESD